MKAISLFSGAGGLDVGFKKAGFDILWANDFDKNACETYAKNIGEHVHCGDIDSLKSELHKYTNEVDLVFGGPPCQGFSVAGKMNPDDPRSKHIWSFAEIVDIVKPKAFVMENVKALGSLSKWEPIRSKLLKHFRENGYAVNFVVLNATDFNVPQARERVFFIGFKSNPLIVPDLDKMLDNYRKKAPTVRESLSILDKAGTGNNSSICKAKITLTPNPVLRKSPYAGMLFNGAGRPVRINGYCATLPASMGGNKTPIIDEDELYENKESWVESYHSKIMQGGSPSEFKEAPKRLRRLTVEECSILQTFPEDYEFCGSQSSIFKQIGNAVPCNLGFSIANMLSDYLTHEQLEKFIIKKPYQLEIA
ncbi:MAG: DNA cytosine methyltransferase [Candidatus Neomarinimicrobiota bacterium]|jgi:DNA (cytosine-5)-methyltransferase 1